MKINNFRYDINGLRAYAVAFVVLFHFGISGFSAGFIGVDIFFVISGFLMTKIIFDKVISNDFSIINFILSRAIRIIPALLIVTVITFIIGWFILDPSQYKKYGAYAASSIVFLSNFLYWKKTGDYFSTNAHEIPLLHTWSLSVEWQFYILFPIVLLIIKRLFNSEIKIKYFIVLITLLSLLFSIYISKNNPTLSFFLLPSRAWEMLFGGLIYLFFNSYKNNNIFYIGIILLFISLIFINSNTIWPGYMALIPVLGSSLILTSNKNDSIILNNRLAQSLGDWSYSIYLWHWPIVFFLTYLEFNNTYYKTIGILSSILLGFLSYKFVENPTRTYLSNLGKYKSIFILFISTVLLFSIYSITFMKQGFISRSSEIYKNNTVNIKMPRSNDGWCFYDFNDDPSLKIGKEGLECTIGNNSTIKSKAILIGDSFAGHNSPFWDHVGKNLNINIHGLSTNWCYPSLNEDYTGPKSSSAYKQCLLDRKYFRENLSDYDVIILAGMWSGVEKQGQLNNLKDLIIFLSKEHKKIIIMDEPYAFDVKVGDIYKKDVWLDRKFDIKPYLNNSKTNDQIKVSNEISSFTNEHSNVYFLKRSDLFDSAQVTPENIPYSLEGTHLSVYGSLNSAKYFMEQPSYSRLKDFLESK